MTGRDVSEYDMPDFPWRADRAVPADGDGALDELLTAGQPPQDAAAGLQPVAAVLAALRAGPADGMHAGHARALAEFRNTVGVSHPAGRGRARRRAPLRRRLSSKLAVITAAAAAAAIGTAAAAYVGALPGPLQRAAHDVIAAPAADAGHGRAAPAAVGARPFPARSAAGPRSPAGNPGRRHGQAGPAGMQHKRSRHGHHAGHKAWWPPATRACRVTGMTTGRPPGLLPGATATRWPTTREAVCNCHSPEQRRSRFRPQAPAGRGPAGAEPRAGSLPPGDPARGPFTWLPQPPAEVNGPGWLGQERPVP